MQLTRRELGAIRVTAAVASGAPSAQVSCATSRRPRRRVHRQRAAAGRSRTCPGFRRWPLAPDSRRPTVGPHPFRRACRRRRGLDCSAPARCWRHCSAGHPGSIASTRHPADGWRSMGLGSVSRGGCAISESARGRLQLGPADRARSDCGRRGHRRSPRSATAAFVPTRTWRSRHARQRRAAPVPEGSVGAGTGATVGKMFRSRG